ncbi:Filamentous growth regulator 27-like protein [Cladobotryum mycophilum]|uniref:Filamentous growth regulator 27-like protein n=1 Tax=Cladobotryum mycophilum TaxID=491253 RepID=A0ABR0SCZ2_9HYPO
MTRPRVPDDKRQRTARACDSCKRRKQKCNGLHPCNTCLKRTLECKYIDGRSPPKSTTASSPPTRKRRHVAEARTSTRLLIGPEPAPTIPLSLPVKLQDTPLGSTTLSTGSQDNVSFRAHTTPATSDGEGSPSQSLTYETDDDQDVEIIRQPRMLEDEANRLLYIGDASSISFVQLIRMLVDHTTGSSPFTLDPLRHKMLDLPAPIPQTSMVPYILPDRETSNLIVQSFFTNTHGMIEVFDQSTIGEYLDACYSNPLSVSSSTLCLVYLTLAIGLVMAAPTPGSVEESIFQRLQSGPLSRAEALFRAAKGLCDPLNGVEEADLWVIQALILMTVYLVVTAKSTAAYIYCGMAIRSASVLGLHRTRDTMTVFGNNMPLIRLRWNIWRTLFILDRFLSVSFGRPFAIYEEDCPYDSLEFPKQTSNGSEPATEELFASHSLDSTMKSSQSIGHIVRGVYSRDTISTKLAQGIVDEFDVWSINVHPSLSSNNIFKGNVPADKGIAILHAYLAHYHSIILLTRPFFSHLLVKTQMPKPNEYRPLRRTYSRIEKFSQACVAASTWSITLIQAVHDAKYLPRRNPFVLYFLFSAGLVILSNEFAGLYQNTHYATSIASVFNILEFCAETDTQAPRILHVFNTFHSSVKDHIEARQKQVPSFPELSITDPVQILDSRRRSVAAAVYSPRTTVSSSTPGGSTMSSWHHRQINGQSTAPPPQQPPPPLFGMDGAGTANSRRPSTQSRTDRSSYHRTDEGSVRTGSIGGMTDYELDFEGSCDVSPGLGEDDCEEYVHVQQRRRVSTYGSQPALQLRNHGYGGYPGAGAGFGNQGYGPRAGVH